MKLFTRAKAAIITIVVISLLVRQGLALQLTSTTEYRNYVHTGVNSSQGNYTYIEKPFFPVIINNSQIQIGQNWTILCPLEANHNYHVYCYGTWVNTSSAAKTDYDIYVFDPKGNLESSHTEAAGFPEHLGTTTTDSLFTPKQSGNYSFVLKNDPRESEGCQQATFMIIENLDCDSWHTLYVEGKNDQSLPTYHTSWAYEFVTNATKTELYVKVPQTLDMYEARLYLMNDAKSPTVNSFPLPWEPGLFSNVSNRIGGYNFENEGYRGVAYASCEYRGQSMFLNYTSTNKVTNLYHIVFIGEEGSGNIEFMVKTSFENVSLLPLNVPTRVLPYNSTEISYLSNNYSLESGKLLYTINGWNSTYVIDMKINDKTCNATIPGQEAGSIVQYKINATDVLKNQLIASGNYSVKQLSTLNITSVSNKIRQGENITIYGVLTPSFNDSSVKVQFDLASLANSTKTINYLVNSDGSFFATFKPECSGNWTVTANSLETRMSYGCESQQLTVTVIEPPFYVRYILFIIIGIAAVSAVSTAVYFFKFRGT